MLLQMYCIPLQPHDEQQSASLFTNFREPTLIVIN